MVVFSAMRWDGHWEELHECIIEKHTREDMDFASF